MRYVDSAIFKDDFFGMQPLRLRLLWIGLINSIADDQGRFIDKPLTIKLEIFPYDLKITVQDIETDLRTLAKNKKIVRYLSTRNDGNRRLVQIINWWRYQRNAQRAGRSTYPAPAKWTDRIRCHERGSGQTIVTAHWDQTGGYSSKPLPSHKVTAVKPLAGREDKHEDEDKDKEEQASKAIRKTADLKGQAPQPMPAAADPVVLTPVQQRAAAWARPVLVSLGLKNKKLESTLSYVATRNLNGNLKHHVLGTIAATFADGRKANKPIIVALKYEQGEDPAPEFMKPEAWHVIPKGILLAAGIKNLEEMFSRPELERYKPVERDYDPAKTEKARAEARAKMDELKKKFEIK